MASNTLVTGLNRILARLRRKWRRKTRLSILERAQDVAAEDTAKYYLDNMTLAEAFESRFALLDHAVDSITISGLILEFGVATGATINRIAERTKADIYGFDSFEGLPEKWITGRNAGRFKRAQPPEVRDNVHLVIGWFNQTLPKFLSENAGPIALLHVDCDIYASTREVFAMLSDRIKPGTIIVFDEYFNYPGWRKNEYKAFQEFVQSSGREYEYIGFVNTGEQVLCRIK